MVAYLLYLLKVSVCIIVFYTFYIVVLRNCTFFLLNRFYLVISLLLSFLIPILQFSMFKGQSGSAFSTLIHTALIEPESDFFQPQNLITHATTINFSVILSVIYFTGVSILFFKLLFSIVRIIRIKNNSETYQFGKLKILKTESVFPFSFFNLIFLPKTESNQMIIEHEKAHIKQFHWLDLIITEIASVLLWFNPFVVLYKSSLKLQHEYLADSSVIKNNVQIENYLGCMLKRIQIESSNGLISQFYCKTIKKRIIMITKNKTSVKYVGVYLIALPLICLLLFAFTSNANKGNIITKALAVETLNDTIPSIYPVNIDKVTKTSDFGWRINPKNKKKEFHSGIDFKISEGEKIVSTASGVVIEVENSDIGYGNFVVIKNSNIFSTFFAHLKSISVKVGDKLEKGQIIGDSGNTGVSTGPHLHYEVIKNGEKVDPKDYLPK